MTNEVVLSTSCTDRWGDHLPRDDMPVADQAQCAVTFVFIFNPFGLPCLHRNLRRDALDRLDAGHFINRDRVRIVLEIQAWRLLICLANELHLLIKHLLVLLFCVEPVLTAVRLKVRFLQIATDLTDRYRGHNLTLDGFFGQLTMRPIVNRSI